MEEKITIKLDMDAAASICKQLLEPFDNAPAKAYMTILNAFTMALEILAANVKQETECDDVEAVEKQILRWMTAVDKKAGLDFSKFIDLEAIKPKE